MGTAKGFTLIEIMIVVALIGIISAIAIPQYTQYVIRGNRAAAQSIMMDVASREKQYLLDARSYTDSLTTLGVTLPTEVTRNYGIAINVDAAPPTFTITASPLAGSQQENDGNLTLTDTGAKTHGASNNW